MYKEAVEDRCTFTPFFLSVDGLLHKKADHFLKHMAMAMPKKWDKPIQLPAVMAEQGFLLLRFRQ